MLFVYRNYMPLRVLEEIQFWKTQEKEHTVVIREITPLLEPAYVQLLQAWEPVFARTETMAEKLLLKALEDPEAIPPDLVKATEELLKVSAVQSRKFVSQLTALLERSPAVAASPFVRTVIRHIIRESDYFLCVLESLLEPLSVQKEEGHHPDHSGQSVMENEQDLIVTIPQHEELHSKKNSSSASVKHLAEKAHLHDWSDTRGASTVPPGGHTLPPLPYGYDALEPHIDQATMQIHHDIHHQSYVDGLNKAENELKDAREKNDFELVKHWERELAFNGAGHYLHTLYWNVMSPRGGGEPTGSLARQIRRDFGSYDAFKNHFSAAAEKVEGGGWAILVWSPRSRRLEILTAEKHQNLSQWDVVPVLPLDVWEHAYYLKHQNKRPEYIQAWWNVVNWPYASGRFSEARKLVWEPF
ncbi:Fe-Mn family superoxide dismutase [Paenibacillus nasutitermitis]|uniref:superoxide dismutase n=1 Tax=Paenibacillus nasutitermitis TaxID=1652958 RepID=A0A916ZCF8_9BACL|nr:Fe-Mn family superoxide dismutase [Paenibacillus nasutitermitis]GGD87636.1 hypothetical protein GCM10010911_52610 [Paenibacillus nasutitermitis]